MFKSHHWWRLWSHSRRCQIHSSEKVNPPKSVMFQPAEAILSAVPIPVQTCSEVHGHPPPNTLCTTLTSHSNPSEGFQLHSLNGRDAPNQHFSSCRRLTRVHVSVPESLTIPSIFTTSCQKICSFDYVQFLEVTHFSES